MRYDQFWYLAFHVLNSYYGQGNIEGKVDQIRRGKVTNVKKEFGEMWASKIPLAHVGCTDFNWKIAGNISFHFQAKRRLQSRPCVTLFPDQSMFFALPVPWSDSELIELNFRRNKIPAGSTENWGNNCAKGSTKKKAICFDRTLGKIRPAPALPVVSFILSLLACFFLKRS